jgi:hypothetical protein
MNLLSPQMSQNAQKKRSINPILDPICVNLRNLWTKRLSRTFKAPSNDGVPGGLYILYTAL